MTKKKSKRQYRIRNWPDYNKAVVGRGSLTLWVSEDVLRMWREIERTGRRGRPYTYTPALILCMATLEEVYHLPLRAAEGLKSSIVRLLGVELRVPCYTTLSRRRRALEIDATAGAMRDLKPDVALGDAKQSRGRGVKAV